MYTKNSEKPLSKYKETIADVQALKTVPLRGIPKSVLERFGVKVAVSTKDGRTPSAIYFPIYRDGKVVDYKKKNLEVPKGARDHFTWITGVGGNNCAFFGANTCNPNKRLYIFEGELDAMSGWYVLDKSMSDGGKYQYSCVSLTTGTAGAASNVASNLDFLNQYKEIVTVFDNDKATDEELKRHVKKGLEATNDVHMLLADMQTFYVPLKYKDANDYLKHKEHKLLARTLQWELQEYKPEYIKTGDEVDIDNLTTPVSKGIGIECLPKTSKILRGIRPNELTIILARPKAGKALAFGTKVLTPDGYIYIEDVTVGQKVFGDKGITEVIGVYPQGDREVYEVEFNDGSSCECCEEHLWTYNTYTQMKPSANTDLNLHTNSIKWMLDNTNIFDGTRVKAWLPQYEPIEFNEQEFFIHPYIIGVLIGDGGLTSSMPLLTNTEEDILQKVMDLSTTPVKRRDSRSVISFLGLDFKNELIRLGLFGKYSYEKYIPDVYKYSSVLQRISLLKGLIDTDGEIDKGQYIYSTSSKQLADDVLWVARSLGCKASIGKTKKPIYTYKGEVKKGRDNYRVYIRPYNYLLHSSIKHSKKLSSVYHISRHCRKGIKSIRKVGVKPTVCIEVSAENGLFLINDFIVTHNSTLLKEIGYSLNLNAKKLGHLFLEEDLKKTQQSYIAIDNNVRLPAFREDPSIIPRDKVEKSVKKLIDNDRTLWLSHFGSLQTKRVMEILRYMAVMGCDVILFDHLSMVFSGSESNNERKEIDLLLTEMAAFCKQYPVALLVVAHIKVEDYFRPPRDENGDILYPYFHPVADNAARGSGSFSQLCWNMLAIEPEIIDDEGTRGRVRTRVMLNREWGDTGVGDILRMDKGTGRFVNAEGDYDAQ